LCEFRPVTLTVGFNSDPAAAGRADLKPKFKVPSDLVVAFLIFESASH